MPHCPKEAMNIEQRQEEVITNFSLFEDWTQKYEYIISNGRKLPKYPEEYRKEEFILKGCQSNVWITGEKEGGKIFYIGDSDASITKGILSFFIQILNGSSAKEIVSSELFFIHKTEMKNHLAPTRANALSLISQKMKEIALKLEKAEKF